MTMTTTRSTDARALTAPNEGDVAQFLQRHPDFFADHSELLTTLRLPHPGGGTVSLVERQLDLLREQKREYEQRYAELITIGRGNDALAAKMHRLACRLISARRGRARLEAIEACLREDFAVAEFVLVLTRAGGDLNTVEARHLRIVPAESTDIRSFDSLWTSGRPRCGQVRDSQRDFLFPNAGSAIGSAALVPLTIHHAPALLAIGSPHADHFNPAMATEYLERIGELIATALDGAEDDL